jgi:GNAT superfamily N-acetyltransferase
MDTPPRIELLPPDTPEALAATREIFREYAGTLGVDLCFQNFDAELAALPGEYAGPSGGLLLAWVDGQLAGCGAFRPLADVDYANACEMKRLYVRRGFRRFGLGRQLAQALMDQAVQAGYSAMLLDTLDDMEAARELYASLGFAEVPPYYFNPIPGAHYLKAELG